MRWCGACAEQHTGATSLREKAHKMCEECGLKQPSYGHPADQVMRWCAPCAKHQAGAVSLRLSKMSGLEQVLAAADKALSEAEAEAEGMGEGGTNTRKRDAEQLAVTAG
jgi:hypothetical protein